MFETDRSPSIFAKRLGRALSAAVEPMCASAAIFSIQAGVLLSSGKFDFGEFSLIYSYVLMGQVLLSAFLGGPLISALGHLDEPVKQSAGQAMLRFALIVAILCGTIGGVAGWKLGLAPATVVLAALCLIVLVFRDALRSVAAAQLSFLSTLMVTLAFGALTAVLIVTAVLVDGRVTSTTGLAILAGSGLLAISPFIVRSVFRPAPLPRPLLLRLLAMGGWSLPGAGLIWLQNNFYLTIVAASLGIGAVAEVSAARLAVMPILIGSSGLLRLLQVHASRDMQRGDIRSATLGAHRIAIGALGAGGLLTIICLLAAFNFPSQWLPQEYPHLIVLIAGWLLFATAAVARSAYSALYQAMGEYRRIFACTLPSVPLALCGVWLLPRAMGLIGAVLPLAAAELLLLALLACGASKRFNPVAHPSRW